jgi:hypothetical protein
VKRDVVASFEAVKLTSLYILSHHKIEDSLSKLKFLNSVLGFLLRNKVVGKKLQI